MKSTAIVVAEAERGQERRLGVGIEIDMDR